MHDSGRMSFEEMGVSVTGMSRFVQYLFNLFNINITLMLPSESKSKKQKSNSKVYKELKKSDKMISKIQSPNSKKSIKNTPHHSKQKNNELTPKLAKQQSNKSQDYYATTHQYKKVNDSKQSINLEEIQLHGKKHRRNNPDPIKEKDKIQNKIHKSKQKNDYDQPIYFKETQSETENKNKNPLFKKIKMLSSQGSIDFNGEIVRKNRLETDLNKNFFSHKTHSNYSPTTNDHLKKQSKKKGGSKGKPSEKKGKISSSSKRKDKKAIKQEEGRQSRRSGMNTDHTNRNNLGSVEKSRMSFLIERSENIFSMPSHDRLQDIYQEIQEDSQNVYEYLLSQELIKERGQCLNMLGKICSSMNLKRETFAIAMCYMDSFMDINTEIKTVKTIAIASLMMGLKIDHAEVIGSAAQMETLSSMQSFSMNKGLSISTEARSQERRVSGKKDSSKYSEQQQSKQPRFNLNRPKLPNVLTTVLSHQQIFSEYDRILCKEEIMDMQMQMMVKLNFKLTLKSYTYWIQTLSFIWDSFINHERPKLKGKATFKLEESFRNLSFLFQLVEISYYFPYAYFYPKSILVLSIMYLLIRIKIQFLPQKQEKGFDHYKSNLGKSTNIIFIDKAGTNQLFGEFLGLFHLDMGDIVNCCQYVSHYLSHKILRVFTFDPNRSITFEQHSILYHYNPQIFRFFQLKCSNCIDRGQA